MYHRFEENKYPSTNIKMDVFKKHMGIIKNNFEFFDPKDLEKEFQWFTTILIIFLAVITLIGTTDDGVTLSYSVYAMAVFGFTLVWVIRSAAIKKFS